MKTLLAAALIVLVPPTMASAQDGQEKPAPRVTLPQSVGPAGGTVSVPVQIASDGVPLGTVKLVVRYPAAKLTFTKVELGGLASSVDASATAATESVDPDMVLKITIATPAEATPREPVPDGPVAQVVFTVAKGLKPESTIPLKVEATATDATPSAAPVQISARDGEIIVSNPPVISCFFYMH